jgi:hypothetical protein
MSVKNSVKSRDRRPLRPWAPSGWNEVRFNETRGERNHHGDRPSMHHSSAPAQEQKQARQKHRARMVRECSRARHVIPLCAWEECHKQSIQISEIME